ncbi:MAG TPA: hypothetical protein VLE95_06365 [Chlamydiales bacterium]|nr:hypothetical protein [Chlamydiales bacterium]
MYTRSDSKVGLWAGSKRRKSILEKGASIEEYNPLFKNRFSAAFNPAQRSILESFWVYTQKSTNPEFCHCLNNKKSTWPECMRNITNKEVATGIYFVMEKEALI